MYLVRETLDATPAGRHEGWHEAWVDEFERVYGYIQARVGNRADAEDLTQQVALKAWPRLREDAPAPAVRAYLFATARSVLAVFWTEQFRLPTTELADDAADPGGWETRDASPASAAWLERTLAALPGPYRKVLELRFLREYSLREAASEMGRSVGAIKLLQLRALRAAARVGSL